MIPPAAFLWIDSEFVNAPFILAYTKLVSYKLNQMQYNLLEYCTIDEKGF